MYKRFFGKREPEHVTLASGKCRSHSTVPNVRLLLLLLLLLAVRQLFYVKTRPSAGVYQLYMYKGTDPFFNLCCTALKTKN